MFSFSLQRYVIFSLIFQPHYAWWEYENDTERNISLTELFHFFLGLFQNNNKWRNPVHPVFETGIPTSYHWSDFSLPSSWTVILEEVHSITTIAFLPWYVCFFVFYSPFCLSCFIAWHVMIKKKNPFEKKKV